MGKNSDESREQLSAARAACRGAEMLWNLYFIRQESTKNAYKLQDSFGFSRYI
jgi:hypothetical protein